MWDPKAKKIIKQRDVTFLREGGATASVPTPAKEPKVVRLDLEEPIPCEQEEQPALLVEVEQKVADDAVSQEPDAEQEITAELENDNTDVEVEVEVAEPEAGPSCDTKSFALPPRKSSHPSGSPTLRRSGRERGLPGKFKDFFFSSKGLSLLLLTGCKLQLNTMRSFRTRSQVETSHPWDLQSNANPRRVEIPLNRQRR